MTLDELLARIDDEPKKEDEKKVEETPVSEDKFPMGAEFKAFMESRKKTT